MLLQSNRDCVQVVYRRQYVIRPPLGLDQLPVKTLVPFKQCLYIFSLGNLQEPVEPPRPAKFLKFDSRFESGNLAEARLVWP